MLQIQKNNARITEQHPGALPSTEIARPATMALPTRWQELALAAWAGASRFRGRIHRRRHRPAPATGDRAASAGHSASALAARRLAPRSQSLEWLQLAPELKATQTAVAERFLVSRADESEALCFGNLPIDQLKRRHIKVVLARYAVTPHEAAHIRRLIRKLTGAALDSGATARRSSVSVSLSAEKGAANGGGSVEGAFSLDRRRVELFSWANKQIKINRC